MKLLSLNKGPCMILLAAVVILSSCKVDQSVSNGRWLQKRKYTKGFHVKKKVPTKRLGKSVASEKEVIPGSGSKTGSDSVQVSRTDHTAVVEVYTEYQQKTKDVVSRTSDLAKRSPQSKRAASSEMVPLVSKTGQKEAQAGRKSAVLETTSDPEPVKKRRKKSLLLLMVCIVLTFWWTPVISVLIYTGFSNLFWKVLLLTGLAILCIIIMSFPGLFMFPAVIAGNTAALALIMILVLILLIILAYYIAIAGMIRAYESS